MGYVRCYVAYSRRTLGCPPASFAFLFAKSYIVFPVGLVTGVIMYAIVCTGNRQSKALDREHRLVGILK